MSDIVEHWLSMPDIVDKLRCPVIHNHLTLYYLNIDEALPVMAEAAAEIERLRTRVAKLEERLEIDHCYTCEGDGPLVVRKEIPPDERDSFPDGVEARDETIKLMRAEIERLRAVLDDDTIRPRRYENGQMTALVMVATHLSNDENRIVGAIMKATGGSVNPMVIRSMIRKQTT